jgi:AraC-like DNA-binding protein
MTFHSRKLLLQNALELARGHNVEPSLLLSLCDLDEESAWNERGLVPTTRIIEVLERAAALSRRNDFGLKWGERADYRSFGALGLAIRHERTLGRALLKAGQYMRQLNVGHHYAVTRSQGAAVLQVRYPAADGIPARHYCEGSALVIVRFARFLSSGQWNPRLVRFAHPRLAGPYAYEKAFGCPVLFDQERAAIETDTASLARRLVFDECPVHAMTQQVLEDMQGDRNPSLPAQIASMVPQLLPAGKATIDHIAWLLNMSPRTLQRRLAAHDTSLKQIVNAMRQSIIHRHVDLGMASGQNLALALGYSEPSAASRFIRSRLGVTKTDLVDSGRESAISSSKGSAGSPPSGDKAIPTGQEPARRQGCEAAGAQETSALAQSL